MKRNSNTQSDADDGGPFRFASGSAVAVTLLGALAFAPTSAQAVASFNVLNDLTVTATVQSGDATLLEMNVQTDLFNDVFGDGTGAASSTASIGGLTVASSTDTFAGDQLGDVVGSFDLVNFGDAVGLKATANGTAGDTLPGPETFFADSINTLDFTVFNNGGGDATVRFSWDLQQQAAVTTDAFGEVADATSSFTAFGEVFDENFNFVDIAFPDIIQDVGTFAFDGSSDNTGLVVTSQFVDVLVPTGFGVSFVTAFVDSFGSATGVVPAPEPGILPLVGIGLIAAGFARARRVSAMDA